MKKKILFVIESLSGGGAEKVLSTLLKHIDKSKYEVTLCTLVDTGNYVDEVKSYVHYTSVIGSPNPHSLLSGFWYSLKYKLVYSWLPIRWVYRWFIPQGFDVEVAFCEGFATKLLAASTNPKARNITWVHIDLKYNPWPQKLGVYHNIAEETAAYGQFDRIIAVSRTVADSFCEVYGWSDRVETVYNPIDVVDIRERSRASVERDAHVMNWVTVGRLVPQKGYDILLQVALKLRDEGYRFKLRILGEGEQRAQLQQFIHQHHLEDSVALYGFKSNPYPYIAASDLFVCSSRSEGYSLVIAESLVLGIPVISTYCSGPNELLDEGKFGMLVENREDGEGLYNGLKQLLDNNEWLDKYKQKAEERGRCFSLSDVMNKIDLILN